MQRGENGLLVPPRNAAALADAIALLAADPTLRAQMGRKGREIASSRFSIERGRGSIHGELRPRPRGLLSPSAPSPPLARSAVLGSRGRVFDFAYCIFQDSLYNDFISSMY